MHIAFILPRSFPYRGGYENSLLALAKYLVQRGHRATIFTTVANDLESFWLPGFRTFPEEQISVDGVTIRRFPISYNVVQRRATRLLGALPYWRWKAQYWRPSFRVPGLAGALRAVDADLFHIGPLPYNGVMYAGLHAGELRGVPVVATPCTHLGEEANDEVARHYVQPHQIALLNHCASVFCLTRSEVQRLAELGVTANKILTGFAIDSETATGGNPDFLRQRYKVDGPVVLHLGMKAFEKGSVTLLEAMKLLWARGSNAWLVMAGPSLSAFDDWVKSAAQNCPRFLNHPAFPDSEKRDFLASATVVAQPSRVESLGLVLIEAWINSKPVIAADIAVSRELITDSGGGALVPFGNAEALAAEIQTLLSDPRLRETMGSRAYKKAAEYEGDTLWRRYQETFEAVLSRASER
ncbi:MAG: glycosyltransferase family 4 protein [Candidatus Korobacteraceae bacterium]